MNLKDDYKVELCQRFELKDFIEKIIYKYMEEEKKEVQYYGKGINDNSESYVIEKFIEDFCGINQEKKVEDVSYGLTKEILESNLDRLFQVLKEERTTTVNEWNTFYHMICFLGVEVTRQLIDEGIQNLVNDEWAKVDLERSIIIKKAINLMDGYINSGYLRVNIDTQIDYSNGYVKDFYRKDLSEEDKKCKIDQDLIQEFEEYFKTETELYTDLNNYYLLCNLTEEEMMKMNRHFFGIKLIKKL